MGTISGRPRLHRILYCFSLIHWTGSSCRFLCQYLISVIVNGWYCVVTCKCTFCSVKFHSLVWNSGEHYIINILILILFYDSKKNFIKLIFNTCINIKWPTMIFLSVAFILFASFSWLNIKDYMYNKF